MTDCKVQGQMFERHSTVSSLHIFQPFITILSKFIQLHFVLVFFYFFLQTVFVQNNFERPTLHLLMCPLNRKDWLMTILKIPKRPHLKKKYSFTSIKVIMSPRERGYLERVKINKKTENGDELRK